MGTKTVNIAGCARCGGQHDGLVFAQLSKPVYGVGYTHWAMCPTAQEPVLMLVFTDGDPESPLPLTLEHVLDRAYAAEINVRVHSFFDAGWEVWLGDGVNGYTEKVNVDTAAEVALALHRLIMQLYSDSTYAIGDGN